MSQVIRITGKYLLILLLAAAILLGIAGPTLKQAEKPGYLASAEPLVPIWNENLALIAEIPRGTHIIYNPETRFASHYVPVILPDGTAGYTHEDNIAKRKHPERDYGVLSQYLKGMESLK